MKNSINKLRLGIVGLGRVATATHIPAIRQLKNVEITACAEKNINRVHRVKEFLSIANIFSDYHEMYKSKLVDAVYVCLPTDVHFDATISALQNGLHVLCEKPMGRTLEEATEMNSLALKNKLILMPGFKYRYDHNLQHAAQVISSGLLGNIIQIEATFMTPGPYISWDPKSEWYLEKKHGGVVYDIGVHIVELINFLVPNKVTQIYSNATQGYYEYETPTNVSCSFTMENNIIGTIIFGWRSSVDLVKVSVYGTGGALIVGLKSFDYYYAGTDPKDRIFNHFVNSFVEAKTVIKRIASIIKGTEVSVNDLEQAKAFVNSIRNGSPPPVTGENAVYVHKVLQGIEKSIQTNETIKI